MFSKVSTPTPVLYIGGSIVCLYLLSLIYTYVYFDKVQEDLKSKGFNGGLFEMATVMMFRGLMNVMLSIVYLPLSIGQHIIYGLDAGWKILVEEFNHIPDILKWIYNSWVIDFLRQWISWVMGYIGWILQPIWTLIVKFVIYSGLAIILLSPIFLGFYWISNGRKA